MITSIPAALSALLADLTSAVGSSASVVDGELVEYVPGAFVLVGHTVSQWEQSPASLGNLRRDEHYLIESTVRVFQGNQDRTTVRTAAFALVGTIEGQLQSDPSLGGAVRFAQLHAGEFRQGVVAGRGGWACEVDFSVHCTVTIQ